MTEIVSVIKRDKSVVPFNPEKITKAVLRAMNQRDEKYTEEDAAKIKNRVMKKLKSWENPRPHVDEIHILVEHSLMDAKLYDAARDYIKYRAEHKPDIFRKKTAILPHEYPDLMGYVDAINHSYWLRSEFNYDPDIQDMKVGLSEKEKTAAERSMLAISQIESAVKKFWGRIDERLPKPEISSVGATFAESEVRHERAYSKLIEILGLQKEFENLKNIPCIDKRIKYLEKVNQNMKSADNKDFFETVILFSMFVENVSLFSQFYVLMSFNMKKNKLKGISNAIEATSKEENIHAQFGFDIVNIIKEENPEWFDSDLIDYIKEITMEAYEAEKEILDWIYEEGDLSSAPKRVVREYIKWRLNNSLNAIGIESVFEINQTLLAETEWFEDEIKSTKVGDFFNKRSIGYTKRTKAINAEELF